VRYLPLLCREAGFNPAVVFETTHSDVLMEMVRAGRGVAVSPLMAVSPGLTRIAIDSPAAFRKIGLLWCRAPQPPPAALTFAEYLMSAVGEVVSAMARDA